MSDCPLCSCEAKPWAMGLKDIYNNHDLGVLCDKCGDKANSFIDYWGEKKQEDLSDLFEFINLGDGPLRKLSAMMNGGYY